MQSSGLVTALVGMTGVVVGSLVSGTFQLLGGRASAKNERAKLDSQLKAEIISKQRQQWMDSVREAAKDMLTEYDLIYSFLQSGKATQERINELFFSSMTKANLIELMLNPEKANQQTVVTALLSLQTVLQCHAQKPTSDNDKSYNDARNTFKSSLQTLFRETWLKIKALEA